VDKDSQLLRKVDPDRREFLRRLSLAAAYATPVVTSYSFDSLIPTATAQGVYTTPARVLDVVFIPGSGTKGLIVSRVAQPDEPPYGTIRITYSKPMETSLNSCKKAIGYGCECEIIESKIDVIKISVSGCEEYPEVDLSDGWTWLDSTTEEREVFTEVRNISLELNTPELGCSGDVVYQAMDGNHLEPYTGEIDTSEYCEIIISSKIDELKLWGG
jgi:hypothetical protein